MKIVQKSTYPNGQIYVGRDSTERINCFGRADGKRIEKDFTGKQRLDFAIRKEILAETESSTEAEFNQKEVEFADGYRSNDPSIGRHK